MARLGCPGLPVRAATPGDHGDGERGGRQEGHPGRDSHAGQRLSQGGSGPVLPIGQQGVRAVPDPTCTGRGAPLTGAAPTKDRSFAGCARGRSGRDD